MNTAWKHIPLDKLLAGNTSVMIRARLDDAGYRTAGDLIDATPDELADNIKGLGMTRAIKIRQRVFDQIRPPALQYIEVAPPVSNGAIVKDVLLGCVGMVGFLFIIWAAMVMLP